MVLVGLDKGEVRKKGGKKAVGVLKNGDFSRRGVNEVGKNARCR